MVAARTRSALLPLRTTAACRELWGNRVSFKFRAVKLRDYNGRWTELEADPSPFATVVMAHLQAKRTKDQTPSRLSWKLRLVRRLYERGYPRQDVLELFRFIDWVLALPQELEQQFRNEVRKFEEKSHMRYVTSIERLGREEGLLEGIQKGRQEGQQEGQVKVLRRQLTRRFEQLPAWALERLEQSTPADLERWADRILDARRLEDVFATG